MAGPFRQDKVLEWRMLSSIIKDIDEDRSREIHVTDLVYECVRRAYYEKTEGYGVTGFDTAMVLWTGKKLHETGLEGCEHEVPVEMELGGVTVVGRIDELCDGGDLIVDKKTTRHVPSSPYDHHVFQVLLYALALKKMGRRVPSRGAVIYIDVSGLNIRAYTFQITASLLDKVEREATARAVELAAALKLRRPPRPRPGWLCQYCSYVRRCSLDGYSGVEG